MRSQTMTSTPTNEKQSGGVSATVAIPQPTSATKNDGEKPVVSVEEMNRYSDGKIDQTLDDEKYVPDEAPQSKTKSEKIKVHMVTGSKHHLLSRWGSHGAVHILPSCCPSAFADPSCLNHKP